jgi:hypothetical protein
MAWERGPPPCYPFSLPLPAFCLLPSPVTRNLESLTTEICSLPLQPETHAAQEVLEARVSPPLNAAQD